MGSVPEESEVREVDKDCRTSLSDAELLSSLRSPAGEGDADTPRVVSEESGDSTGLSCSV